MERSRDDSKQDRGAVARPMVFVVDDDASIRRSVSRLLATAGFAVESFASAVEFLARPPHPGPACLVLDLHLPDMSGLELQEHLRASRSELPIVFVTGLGDLPGEGERALAGGAKGFLTKPVSARDLLRAIGAALDDDGAGRSGTSEVTGS